MWTYREKDTFLYKLHPSTIILYVVVILTISLCFNHPVVLLGSLIGTGCFLVASGNRKEWFQYLRMTFYMILVITVINVIIVNAGATVLYSGPRLPVIGKFKITLEALCFAMGMGIRLMLMTSAFCVYNYVVDPDKALKLFSQWGNKSVLMITMATRLFPLLLSDFKRISEVQRTRGVSNEKGKLMERIKNTLPVMSALLLSSLERSFQTAESMHARGYGSTRRSVYSKLIWHPYDKWMLGIQGVSLIAVGFILVTDAGTYSYYPRIEAIESSRFWVAMGLMICLSMPAIIGWGWRKWHNCKFKI